MDNRDDGTIILIYAPTFCVPATPPGGREHPPLGLLHIGAALRHAGFGVRLFDFQDASTFWEDVEDCLSGIPNPVVGFTCDSDNIFRVVRLSQKILSRFPGSRIVLGGPHVTHCGESFVSEHTMVVRGDGELPMVMLAEHFVNGKGSLADIPGLMFLSDGEIRANPTYLAPLAEIDGLPFPDYSLLASPETYWPAMSTARGCPYNCYFCSEGNRSRGYRPRSVESIERELVALRSAFGGRLNCMGFADDTFTSSARRILELCDVFDRVFPDKKRFSFFCEGRVNVLGKNPELVFRLRDAGMVRMLIGIEAGNQVALDRMNKRIRLEDLDKFLETCAKADVPSILGFLICGLPGQTEADVLHDIEYAKHLVDISDGRLEISMAVLSALPGTEFRINARKWGLRILDGDFATGTLLEGCFSETDLLSKSDIVRLWRQFNTTIGNYALEKASWLTPERIKRHFSLAADHRVYTWLLRKFVGFLHLDALLDLRRRPDHRFLFELSAGEALDSAPLRLRQNSISPSNGNWVINGDSPFRFEVNPREYAFYEYFNGKLTFREIGRRVAEANGNPAEWGINECGRIYKKCEDKLACIATT